MQHHTAIAKGNHKAGEIQGQTRQHSRLINLLGVKQICIGVNKMDCGTAGYKEERYDEIANEMKSMLIKVGWKKDFVEKNTPAPTSEAERVRLPVPMQQQQASTARLHVSSHR